MRPGPREDWRIAAWAQFITYPSVGQDLSGADLVVIHSLPTTARANTLFRPCQPILRARIPDLYAPSSILPDSKVLLSTLAFNLILLIPLGPRWWDSSQILRQRPPRSQSQTGPCSLGNLMYKSHLRSMCRLSYGWFRGSNHRPQNQPFAPTEIGIRMVDKLPVDQSENT